MDSVDRHKRIVLSYVMFLQNKEPDDTEAIAELNKYCMSTLYNMKNKLIQEYDGQTYKSLLNRGHTPTVQEGFAEWMERLKSVHPTI